MSTTITNVDIQIINAQVLDVFNLTFETTTIWIKDNKIYALGSQPTLLAHQIFDAKNNYVVPGIIDAHMHIESSLLNPVEFGKLALTRGITTVFADPHEIANVKGTIGLDYMLAAGNDSPITIQYMLPSSVPAVSFEHAGATLTASDLKPYYQYQQVGGLAEVMDFPAVESANPDMLTKINDALQANKQVDGHTAGLLNSQLDIYRYYGIATDHESRNAQEALARIRAGFYVYLREGTVERDLQHLLPAVNAHNYTRFAFATDDKTVSDILAEGGVDFNIAKAIKLGLKPAMAYTMASLNAAQSHLINDLGAIAPGFIADLLIIDNLETVHVLNVMKNGHFTKHTDTKSKAWNYPCMNYTLGDLKLTLSGEYAHVIGIKPGHIDTEHLVLPVPSANHVFLPSTKHDLAKIVVVERHKNLGTMGLGIVKGLGLTGGAIASSISHDSHNLIAAGMDDQAIKLAIEAIAKTNGGLAVVSADYHVTILPLSIAGLMSDQDYLTVNADYQNLLNSFKKISAVSYDPFLTLSFLALPVIPTLKITDQGLFDFTKFSFIDINASSSTII
ncbi:adenine deaminase [Periweissella beninensis]|uniref:Adenine deaminase n=1 Tax=Periweissella beninensis TaxID=504936 RepID=A0ABT0VKM1_9LACO|nr:adenine deaminase [Periweissella beninensis]MBM7543980.1 adenine deaminase [Periweissella beninensis]MCM2437989.1 adenine deaminase [Periweissella beninensis]MCT4396762.1 adenine deaminase [Periweissella beninensis]